MAALISTSHQDLLARLIVVNVRNDAVTITVSELNRERLECVPLRHVVLNAMLELCRCEITSADSLKFIVCEGC